MFEFIQEKNGQDQKIIFIITLADDLKFFLLLCVNCIMLRQCNIVRMGIYINIMLCVHLICYVILSYFIYLFEIGSHWVAPVSSEIMEIHLFLPYTFWNWRHGVQSPACLLLTFKIFSILLWICVYNVCEYAQISEILLMQESVNTFWGSLLSFHCQFRASNSGPQAWTAINLL